MDWQSWLTEPDLAEVFENLNFARLETLYLPTNIPEDFRLHRITVNAGFVQFLYMHKEDGYRQRFLFSFSRSDYDPSTLLTDLLRQNNASEEDLIESRYLFIAEPDHFTWVSDRGAILRMYTPVVRGDVAMENGSPADMVRFTEIGAANLQDMNEVAALVGDEVMERVKEIVDERW